MNGTAPGWTPAPSVRRKLVESKGKPKRQLPVIETNGERIEPRVRGEGLLRAGERLFARLDAAVTRWVRPELNPFAQTGAIANTSFIIACITGVVVLIWYRTSVHQAYGSIAEMSAFPAGFVRSLHRYSSDAALLFALLHATKLFFARRFGGARWLAWITGGAVVSLLWLVGWLGYWLVWDERGHKVALATAHLLDSLPIFADPLSRGFLTDEGTNSLLFFVVFFLHMLIPLAMGIGLWLHITRLARPAFLTKAPMTLAVLAALGALSVVSPADLALPARMASIPREFAMDAWFLLPITLTDRLSSGATWALFLCLGAALLSVPWALARGRARPAVVTPARCTACEKCYVDCPYDAIRMEPRKDGRQYPTVAVIDTDKCVGCGVCAGSCDSSAIGLPWFDAIHQRHRVDDLIALVLEKSHRPALALACAESAAAELAIDPETGCSASLPGYQLVRVPCAGWIHPLLVERALKRGADRVLLVACGPGSCKYREGGDFTLARMTAAREPKLRLDRVDGRFKLVELDRHQHGELVRSARTFLRGKRETRSRHPVFAASVGLLLAASISGLTWAATRFPYRSPQDPGPELFVSLKLPGRTDEACRALTKEELRARPVHMQVKEICERRRADVRLRVSIDGREVLRRAYPPHGLWGDGNSIALERIAVTEGKRMVRVEVGDTHDQSSFPYSSQRALTFEARRRSVVQFDQQRRFAWH